MRTAVFKSARRRGAHGPALPAATRALAGGSAAGRNCRAIAGAARRSAVYAGSGALGWGPGFAGPVDAGPQWAAGGDRAQGRRGPAPALAGPGLLDPRTRAERRPPAWGGHGRRTAAVGLRAAGVFSGSRGFAACAAAAAGCSGFAHSPGQRAGAALLFSAGGVGTDRAERALAAGVEGGVPEAERGRAELGCVHTRSLTA